jgi:uncharacterized protein (UPF0147 family)
MDLKSLQDMPPWDWPDGSAKMFRKILTDRRADAALLNIIGNSAEPPELRAKAAISLGPALESATDGFDDPDDVPINEGMFRKIRKSLEKLYADRGTPKDVRRRILEAAVRAPEDWHVPAVRQAYLSGDAEWLLTAVFAMRWIPGFDEQILASLENPDPEIHFEAVVAAGEWEIAPAWAHIVGLIESPDTPKNLLLAAISSVATIRPDEAGEILGDLADSEDEDIAEAADEALMMAETLADDEIGDDEDDDDEDEEGDKI